jgi:hypothetical protein
MTRTVLVVACLLALGAGVAPAAINFHGVLNTGRYVVDVDSARFEIGVTQLTLPCPGWGGAPQTLDSFQFEMPLSQWPNLVTLYTMLDSAMAITMSVPNPIPEFWYPFMVPPPAPQVAYWSTVGLAADEPGGRPAALEVRPSVIRGRAAFSVRLPQAGDAVLEIFDAAGNPARRFEVAAGTGSVSWDGTGDAGNLLAEGVYFCRLTAGGETTVRKVLLAR